MTDDYSTRAASGGTAPRARPGTRALIAWFIVAACCSALTARLGAWQLSRAHQKLDAAALVAERSGLPALAAAELARDEPAARAQWERRITLRGQWVPDHTVFLANRTMEGQAGFFVVTPLRLPTGDAVVVQRGWVPLERGDPWRAPALPPPPAGDVEVAGHVAPWPSHWIELGQQHAGAIRQNLDRAAFAGEAGSALRPLTVIEDATAANAGDGLGRRWTPPAVNVTVNYGYAAQWFAMSVGFLVLYAWLAFFRHRKPDDAGDGTPDHP
jgi:surfeit locus 1 family protein